MGSNIKIETDVVDPNKNSDYDDSDQNIEHDDCINHDRLWLRRITSKARGVSTGFEEEPTCCVATLVAINAFETWNRYLWEDLPEQTTELGAAARAIVTPSGGLNPRWWNKGPTRGTGGGSAIPGRPNLDLSFLQQILRDRYGCTCGICTGGFLSPRTHLVLQDQAQLLHNNLGQSLDDLPVLEWVERNIKLGEDMGFKTREKLETSREAAMGYLEMFLHVSQCLQQQSNPLIPNEKNILKIFRSSHSSMGKAYLSAGGQMCDVGYKLFRHAEEAWKQVSQDQVPQEYEALRVQFDALPSCFNDGKWHAVQNLCGYRVLAGAEWIFR
ncbi:hypothetical protein B0T21DRAFT_407380 [Apiosordaria backusii]|uniref:Uncharacterized protein n=1 Tax=Apiosordaria backusii TaxID=314023 RepID=A0AA40K377_9PEZI|nr:hypothetical protein B0T21DRAFT_407380 [Apiosordaria backusii]